MDSAADDLLAAALKLPRTTREVLVRRLQESLRPEPSHASQRSNRADAEAGSFRSGQQVLEDYQNGRISKEQFIEALNSVCGCVDTSLDPVLGAIQYASLPREEW